MQFSSPPVVVHAPLHVIRLALMTPMTLQYKHLKLPASCATIALNSIRHSSAPKSDFQTSHRSSSWTLDTDSNYQFVSALNPPNLLAIFSYFSTPPPRYFSLCQPDASLNIQSLGNRLRPARGFCVYIYLFQSLFNDDVPTDTMIINDELGNA
jgi:hypothetical protein